MGRCPGKNSSNNLKNNMKTPDPRDHTIEGLEHFNPEEVEKSAIMKAIESIKQDMDNSLKELDECQISDIPGHQGALIFWQT